MARWTTVLGMALVALGPAADLCAGQFNNVVSLGDSLFDDNLGNRSPVAAEHVARQMGVPWTNYARSGATSDAMLAKGQHTMAASNFGAGDLALLWVGGNDFFYQASLPIALWGSWQPELHSALGNVETALSTLRGAGMEVVLFNLPDMSHVPIVDLAATNILGRRDRWLDAYADLSAEWAAQLQELGAEYGAPLVDVYGMFNERLADPDAFSILGRPVNLGPDFGGQFDIFADPIHPSAYIQGLIANEAISVINGAFDPQGAMPIAQLTTDELAELVGLGDGGSGGIGDLLTWEFNFGSTIDISIGVNLPGDRNGDGRVTGADFLLWQRLHGHGGASAANVPEPAAIVLSFFALSVFPLVRRPLAVSRGIV